MGQRILVVDDSRTVCQAVRYAFTATPWDLHVVHSAREASQMLMQGDWAAAIVDYMLPDAPGTQWVSALRQQGSAGQVPVLMLTGSHHAFQEADARSAGVDALLVKPFRTDDLHEKLNEAMQAARSRGSQPAPMAPVAAAITSPSPAVIPPPPAPAPAIEAPAPTPAAGVVARPTAPLAPPPLPPPAAGGFRRVGAPPAPPEAPRRMPLAPPAPTGLRPPIAPPAPPAGLPARRPLAETAEQPALTVPDAPPVIEAPPVIAPPPAYEPPAPTEPIALQPPPAPAPAPPPAHEPEPAEVVPPADEAPADEAPADAAPALAAERVFAPMDAPTPPAAAAGGAIDPDVLRAMVREMLPGIVKEFLSGMLRQTGQKLEQYSQQKIDTFVTQELPGMATQAIDQYLNSLESGG